MMKEVITVHNYELDLSDPDGLSHYVVNADFADMRLMRPAVLYPADLAEPAEYGPGTCSAVFGVDLGEEEPPSDPIALRQYIQDLDLDWELDEED